MTILHSLLFGLIEGLTEFLPISSTFHLIALGNILGLAETPFLKMFEVFIQSGAILALLLMYARTLLLNRNLSLKVITSFIPTALIGFLLYKVIKDVFFSSHWLMLAVFVGVGILFLLIERLVVRGRLILHKSLSHISWKEALWIGLAQATAVIPGISRSGSVLLTMMSLGYKRDEAAKYTFLLSVPTILAASLFDLYRNRLIVMHISQDFIALAIGFLCAFVVAHLVLQWLLKYLANHTLVIFAWYRFIVAGFIIFTLVI